MNKRKVSDISKNIVTYIFSSFGLIILISIMAYVFINGSKNLSWELLTSDYESVTYNVKRDDEGNFNIGGYTYEVKENEFFSEKWGIALIDSVNAEGNDIVEISHIDEKSPLNNLAITGSSEYFSAKKGLSIEKVILKNDGKMHIALAKNGAEKMVNTLDKGIIISDMILKTKGGGIRGSIITTLLLIVTTLVVSLPLGVGAAIYLNEYASKNKFTSFINQMIDLIGGVPSIIFGFFGMFVFVPMCNGLFNTNGTSILSGALTLSVMLLPTIIKTVEEALIIIPDNLRMASLALGASKTQTIFKVILPNSISGILTAVVLAIGRIIGESASLIFALGTIIKDQVNINTNGTSLAVHIWVLMGGEKPNFDTSCAIAIVILLIVLFLNIIVKLFERKFVKYAK